MNKTDFFYFIPAVALLFNACSFDYDIVSESDSGRADIVMENIEYVRVRGGDPLVRFQAEHAQRWEDQQIMELREFTFEQLEDSGDTINAEGRAARAEVQLGSGDISLRGGVRINIESEDIIIMTSGLEWRDKEKILSGAAEDEVDIERSDGTSFSGRGFTADIRSRSWSFSGEVRGRYVEEDEDEEDDDLVSEERIMEQPLPAPYSVPLPVPAEDK